jgi:hypothetical protein
LFTSVWAILNIAATVALIVLIIRSSRKVREKLGLGVAILFGVVAFSLAGRNPYDNADTVKNGHWKAMENLHIRNNCQHKQSIVLDQNWLSEYVLDIFYGVDEKTGLNTATEAWVRKNGTFLGSNWEPLSVLIEDLGNNRVSYSVNAEHSWYLLGLMVIGNAKVFDGEMVLE